MNMFSKSLSVAVLCSSDVEAVRIGNNSETRDWNAEGSEYRMQATSNGAKKIFSNNGDGKWVLEQVRLENGKTVNVKAAVQEVPKVQKMEEFIHHAMRAAAMRDSNEGSKMSNKEFLESGDWWANGQQRLNLEEVAPWARTLKFPSEAHNHEKMDVVRACDVIQDYEREHGEKLVPSIIGALKKVDPPVKDLHDFKWWMIRQGSSKQLRGKENEYSAKLFDLMKEKVDTATFNNELFTRPGYDPQERKDLAQVLLGFSNLSDDDLGYGGLKALARQLELEDSPVKWEEFKSERLEKHSEVFFTKEPGVLVDRLKTARKYSSSGQTPTEFWKENSKELEKQGWNELTFRQGTGEKVWKGADGIQYEIRDGDVVGTLKGQEIFTQEINTTTYMPTPVIEKDLKVLTNEDATAFGLPTIPETLPTIPESVSADSGPSLGDDLKVSTESNSSSEDCCHGDGWVVPATVVCLIISALIIFAAFSGLRSC